MLFPTCQALWERTRPWPLTNRRSDPVPGPEIRAGTATRDPSSVRGQGLTASPCVLHCVLGQDELEGTMEMFTLKPSTTETS